MRRDGVDVTPKTIARECSKGMPGAKRDGRRWVITAPVRAAKWLKDPDKCPRVAARAPIKIPKVQAASRAAKRPPPIERDPIDDHIAEVRLLVDVIQTTIREGGFHPQLFTAFKQTSSELRELILLRRKEKEADARLMPRELHALVVETFARLDQQEAESLPRILPDVIVSALAQGRLEPKNPKKALRIITDAVQKELEKFMARKADHIRQARKGLANE